MKTTKAVLNALKTQVVKLEADIAEKQAEKRELLDILEGHATETHVETKLTKPTKPKRRRKRKYHRRSPNREAVLAVLQDYDRLSPKEIVERCDVPAKSVYSALDGLKKQDLVYKNDDKTWSAVTRNKTTRIHIGATGASVTS